MIAVGRGLKLLRDDVFPAIFGATVIFFKVHVTGVTVTGISVTVLFIFIMNGVLNSVLVPPYFFFFACTT